ncbi:response regulator transcription factor [Bacillus massilinigeriensis]|uniref:response regulator transcription factor n=1 Tax=Bacillus massilionigeriensis TaxID=1805475 RepID=UPI00096B3153|nr:response regulator transcription factor [Bacillus massilionigeriensis]
MGKIKVMFVDDDPDWREGIYSFFDGHSQIDLVSCVSTVEECFTTLSTESVDIIIMDIMLSQYDASGLDATLDITTQFPHIKVIMLSSLDQDDEIFNEAFLNGAYEFVYKQDFEQLPGSIVNAMENKSHKFGERLRKLVFEKKKGLLSKGDIEILQMILKGKTQTEISEELCISLSAVKKHISRIMKKFAWQRTSKELAEKCSKWGLL